MGHDCGAKWPYRLYILHRTFWAVGRRVQTKSITLLREHPYIVSHRTHGDGDHSPYCANIHGDALVSHRTQNHHIDLPQTPPTHLPHLPTSPWLDKNRLHTEILKNKLEKSEKISKRILSGVLRVLCKRNENQPEILKRKLEKYEKIKIWTVGGAHVIRETWSSTSDEKLEYLVDSTTEQSTQPYAASVDLGRVVHFFS